MFANANKTHAQTFDSGVGILWPAVHDLFVLVDEDDRHICHTWVEIAILFLTSYFKNCHFDHFFVIFSFLGSRYFFRISDKSLAFWP